MPPDIPTAAPEQAPPAEPKPSELPGALRRRPVAAVAAIALVLLGWQWIDTRMQLAGLRDELTKRLAEGDGVAKEARTVARQNKEDLLAAQAKLAAVEAKLAEAQGQQMALEAMYQELSKSRDDRLLAEIEQAVTIAAQQLQLAGNVEAALIALQGADARLGRSGNARFYGLRKLLARDIVRLKAMPAADVPGIALKLENVIVAIDAMPLAAEQRPRAEPPAKPSRSPVELSFWQALALDVWNDTKQLVRIERIDRPDPGLLSPSQNFFLRENLKLRLVNARLSLLSRDSRSFKEDLRQALDWLDRYFDGRAKPVQSAQTALRSLTAVDMTTEMPALDETLNTLRNFKVAQDKDAGGARGKAQ